MGRIEIKERIYLEPIKRNNLTPKPLLPLPSLDVKQKKELCLTKEQQELVNEVTHDIVEYTKAKTNDITKEEWIGLIKNVTCLVIAAVKKDWGTCGLCLEQLGTFLLKHYVPNFRYETKYFILTKKGGDVDFKLK